ncbi:MAG: acyltransferase [Muribaculum sp.]|nr:acyltransferase [Muribaculum sp.]
MHSPLPNVDNNIISAVVTYATGPCNALFFMVSGALLIKSTPINFKEFITKRLKRIFLPVLSWSIIYLIVKVVIGVVTVKNAIFELCLFPFQATGCGYFWFMYVLMGCYLIIPIISSWLIHATQRSIQTLLILWFICSFIPLIDIEFSITEEYNSWTYYFSGFFGFLLLGYYIKEFTPSTNVLILCGFAGLLILGFTLYIHPNFYYSEKLYFYTQPYIILLSISIFGLIKRYISSEFKWITKAANATFGIYLMHSLILNYILKENLVGACLPTFLGISLRVILTFLSCYILISIINKTPLKKLLTV